MIIIQSQSILDMSKAILETNNCLSLTSTKTIVIKNNKIKNNKRINFDTC